MIFWKLLSFLGSEEFYLLIMPALLWCGNATLGLRVGVLFLLSANLNSALKLFFHAPRPAWVDTKIVAQALEASFGFPSGHAQNAIAVWGLLAATLKKHWAWCAAALLIGFIGLSRLVLLVHFPGDVLGGWLFGALLLAAFLKLEKPVGTWVKQQSFIGQMLFCVTLSGALVVLSWFLHNWAKGIGVTNFGYQIQSTASSETNFLQEVLSLNQPVKTAGALLGLLVGACWILKNSGYVNGGSKATRYLIGLFGVLLFWFGLGKVLPRGEDVVSLIAAYSRYALVGFWISAGAPLIFRRLESRRQVLPDRPHSS